MKLYQCLLSLLPPVVLLSCISPQARSISYAEESWRRAQGADAKLRALIQLRVVCQDLEPGDVEGAQSCSVDWDKEIEPIRKAHSSADAKVFVVPTSAFTLFGATEGLRPHANGQAFFVCGRLYNFTAVPIKAVKVEAFLFDPFGKPVADPLTLQTQFRYPVLPGRFANDYEITCSDMAYRDISPNNVGRINFRVIDFLPQ